MGVPLAATGGSVGRDLTGVGPGVAAGVLVVAESAELAAAVVGRVVPDLVGAGLDVLVATGEALDLGSVLSAVRRGVPGSSGGGSIFGGGFGAQFAAGGSQGARSSGGRVHGLTVDLSRKQEVERVFRWVDGNLAHLDALIAVVEEVVPDWPQGDLEAWQALLDRHWVMPLLFVEGAAIRMRPRRQGHILQVALTVGAGGNRMRREKGPWSALEEEPVWHTLREMLELRRGDLRASGIGLTVLEVEGDWRREGGGCASGSCSREAAVGAVGVSGGISAGLRARCPSSEDVAEAVDFCLRAEGRVSVESMRLRAPCFLGPAEGSKPP